ncbi:hypothetical protein KGQ20_38635, partial [Catenulispora sp. NF23]|uniref:hypothetical protein n=1 Tax=Catenulispora pinistramenti TaxID=2705254 RepID=UPI0039B4C0B6|nr:hypothetical protein [Catenulispora pinistramenti]
MASGAGGSTGSGGGEVKGEVKGGGARPAGPGGSDTSGSGSGKAGGSGVRESGGGASRLGALSDSGGAAGKLSAVRGGAGSGSGGSGRGGGISPRLVVLAGRKGTPSLLPFVAVLLVLGTVGLVALLFLNTELNKGAFTIKQQKATATKLEQQSEQIQQSLNSLDGPGALASKASQMGMVPNPDPAFLAPNGSVLGSPTPAPTPTPSPSTSEPAGN